VVISGSVPPDAGIDLVPRLIAVARHSGARTAVDVSGPALEAASNAAPDLLAPNAAELAELSGGPRPDPDRDNVRDPARDPVRDPVREALHAAVEVSRRTGSSLLVSLGAAGALWVQAGQRVWHAVPPPVTPVNTAGAGDALLAGWLAGEPDDDDHDDDPQNTQTPRRLARAVAWGTAACLISGTAGDVAAEADATAVTVTDLTSTIDGW
jgi:1-phosphofructokinase